MKQSPGVIAVINNPKLQMEYFHNLDRDTPLIPEIIAERISTDPGMIAELSRRLRKRYAEEEQFRILMQGELCREYAFAFMDTAFRDVYRCDVSLLLRPQDSSAQYGLTMTYVASDGTTAVASFPGRSLADAVRTIEHGRLPENTPAGSSLHSITLIPLSQ